MPDGSNAMLFGVFDGHGGSKVSNYAADHFKKVFIQQLNNTTLVG